MSALGEAWVFLANARRGCLLKRSITEHGRCHLEEIATIRNDWPGHEHQTTSPIWKKATVTFGIRDNDADEETHRFAKKAVRWLEEKMTEYHVGRITVFASSHFLGALRRQVHARFEKAVQLRKGELLHLPLGALSKHPAIQGLLGFTKDDGSAA